MKNKINSHLLQKALLKKLLDKKTPFIFDYKENKIKKINYEKLGSQKGAFYGDKEFAQKLESSMNNFLESDVFNNISKIKDEEEVEFSYQDAFKLRKYLYITFLRLQLINKENPQMKKEITKIIELETPKEYEQRFNDNLDKMSNFFIKQTQIKFIKNSEIPFFMPQNYFLTLPLDWRNTDMPNFIKKITPYPGFIFPISKGMSILLINSDLIKLTFPYIIKEEKLKLKFYISDPTIFFINKNKIKMQDNSIKDAFLFYPVKTNEEAIKEQEKFVKKIKNRDKFKTKYIYKIEKFSQKDTAITFLYNLSCFFHNYRYNNFQWYFNNTQKVVNFIDKYLNIHNFVENNQPRNIIYWADNEEKIFQHTIWELLDDQTISIFKIFIKIYKMNKII